MFQLVMYVMNQFFSASKANTEKIYPCETCDKAFNRKFSLNRHTKTCKGPNVPKKLCVKQKKKIIQQKEFIDAENLQSCSNQFLPSGN